MGRTARTFAEDLPDGLKIAILFASIALDQFGCLALYSGHAAIGLATHVLAFVGLAVAGFGAAVVPNLTGKGEIANMSHDEFESLVERVERSATKAPSPSRSGQFEQPASDALDGLSDYLQACLPDYPRRATGRSKPRRGGTTESRGPILSNRLSGQHRARGSCEAASTIAPRPRTPTQHKRAPPSPSRAWTKAPAPISGASSHSPKQLRLVPTLLGDVPRSLLLPSCGLPGKSIPIIVEPVVLPSPARRPTCLLRLRSRRLRPPSRINSPSAHERDIEPRFRSADVQRVRDRLPQVDR